MKVGVVGAGPAGSRVAHDLARGGVRVTVFDASHPREKPCGGGLTARALDLLPEGPPGDPAPLRAVEECRFESGGGEFVDLRLARPMAVASRRDLDAWLLRRAIDAGAEHVNARVAAIEPDGTVRTAEGTPHRFDVVVGADGAGSLVRRTFLAPTPQERLMMAAGWYARGDSPLLVRFLPERRGYLWLFPRIDHVGVGICAPLASMPTRELIALLERQISRAFPALAEPDGGRYAHTIPCPSSDERSITEVAGPGWALVGDAAGFTDPITGEGIAFALRSGRLLARSLLRGDSPMSYAQDALDDFGRDLVKAARLRDTFYRPGFIRRMVRAGAASVAIRRVLSDLVAGDQPYLTLKTRLLRAGPRFLWDSLRARVGA